MQLTWGERFWLAGSQAAVEARPLDGDARCDVLVVGAGITGALIADALVAGGVDTIVVDKRQPGLGSTSASTALLLYELDTPLTQLIDRVGFDPAVRSYRMGINAIDGIERLVKGLADDCGFSRRPSAYLASAAQDAPDLYTEFECRKKHGFTVEFLDESEVAGRFGFRRPAAIVSRDAAQVDPYRLNQQVLNRALGRGLRLFGDTRIAQVQPRPGGIRAITDAGPAITAGKIVYATGYEAAEYIERGLAKAQITYAVVSEPLESFSGWWEECLIWETARPYLYLRTLSNGRAMIGGEDDPDLRFINDRGHLDRKRDALASRFAGLFPALPFRPAAAWAGVFESTPDGLPYIGPHPQIPNTFVALGYGGNGMTFAFMAAGILRDLCLGRPNPDASIFRLGRACL